MDWEKLGLLVPADCPAMLFQLALNCCALDSNMRPFFDDALQSIKEIELFGLNV